AIVLTVEAVDALLGRRLTLCVALGNILLTRQECWKADSLEPLRPALVRSHVASRHPEGQLPGCFAKLRMQCHRFEAVPGAHLVEVIADLLFDRGIRFGSRTRRGQRGRR